MLTLASIITVSDKIIKDWKDNKQIRSLDQGDSNSRKALIKKR